MLPGAVLHYTDGDGDKAVAPKKYAEAIAGDLHNLELALDPRYRGHPAQFWSDLQRLHDNTDHWNREGLTRVGKAYVEAMREKWNNA